jgi:RNA polymerase sigma-70 factor (ECF subfamily)
MTIVSAEEHTSRREALFEQELLPHADALYNFAYHLTYSDADADDLVQETFMKAYRSIDSYHQGTNAKAWLFKILKNAFINEYRRKSKLPDTVNYEDYLAVDDNDDETATHSLVDIKEDVFAGMMGDEVSGALNSLPDDFRTVILLCDMEGFSYEEIAKIVDIPIGTVRSRLHRARNMLKDKLKDYASKMGFKSE